MNQNRQSPSKTCLHECLEIACAQFRFFLVVNKTSQHMTFTVYELYTRTQATKANYLQTHCDLEVMFLIE